MYAGRKILGVIPARGGSKGVPGKNVREVAGRPLLAWTIAAARASAYIDRLILSSDDAEIMAVAEQWGCDVPFVRPPHLAGDDTPGIAPLAHALQELPDYDHAVLLQPTSPLRTAEDIDRCIELCIDREAAATVSVTAADKHPNWMFELEDSRIRPVLPVPLAERRQDLNPVYSLNGAVYVVDAKAFAARPVMLSANTLAYPMPAERSIDIDTLLDLEIADFLLRRQS